MSKLTTILELLGLLHDSVVPATVVMDNIYERSTIREETVASPM